MDGNACRCLSAPEREHRCHDLAEEPYRHILAHVSPAAYAAQQAADAPKCHPNTRIAVLGKLMDWIIDVSVEACWMMWMYGPAGAGKSSIVRSLVDICIEQKLIVATFFFYSADSNRNTLTPVVASLVYQLIQSLPELKQLVLSHLSSKPLIFLESLEAQCRVLILDPLIELYNNMSNPRHITVIFDGVDEIKYETAQTEIIQTMIRLFQSQPVPIRVLFSSRPEPQIRAEFSRTSVLERLVLDNDYQPDKDIRRFLNESFADLKRSHPYLPANWPDLAHVEELVRKSSGQFVFASVSKAFISDPRRDPETQMDIIRGLKPVGDQTPFAQLDALYRRIFSNVVNFERTALVLVLRIYRKMDTVSECSQFLETWPPKDVRIALADLSALVHISDDGYISIFHASLVDFLGDRTRSQKFYINEAEWEGKIFSVWLTKRNIPGYGYSRSFYENGAKNGCVLKALREANPSWITKSLRDDHYVWKHHLTSLKCVDFGDNGTIYQRYLYLTARAILEHNLAENGSVTIIRRNHDLSIAFARLNQEAADACYHSGGSYLFGMSNRKVE